jgi:hypothetical protein
MKIYSNLQIIFFVLIVNLFFTVPVFAHPGRTDSYGCHTCRTNCAKWGLERDEYHCHNAKALPQPKEPIKSHFSETGGSTTPAPEYKNSKPIEEEKVKNIIPNKDTLQQNSSIKQKKSIFKTIFDFLFK